MLYKVTVTGSRGEEDVYYMDEKTFKSMSKKTVLKAEKVNEEPPNKYDDWQYHRKVF